MTTTVSPTLSSIVSASALPTRSTQGCWTCRLRRKKCDEGRPGCLRCQSVSVQCHYGARPQWMDNGPKAKDELEKIKNIIKVTATRKRAAYREKKRLAPPGASMQQPQDHVPNKTEVFTAPDLTSPYSAFKDDISRSFLNTSWINEDEADLMMHYLDHVFYIQFRFYTPPVSRGRGWLLSLLTCTKPLYHAALSLSAFHRQSLLIDQGTIETNDVSLSELERYQNLTLKELQLFIQDHSALETPGGHIQILACIVQLISFELFNGGTSNWQVHLKAASTLVLILHGISTDSPSSSAEHLPIATFSEESGPRENPALMFLTGTIIWFDALACVASNSRPTLSKHYDRLVDDNRLSLDMILGCQSWAITAIGRIAHLTTQSEMKEDLPPNIDELSCLESYIESNLIIVHADIEAIHERHSHRSPNSSHKDFHSYTAAVVTQIFGCAAMIYLYNADIRFSAYPNSLEHMITAFRLLPDPPMTRSILWPLCVVGCMATTSEEQEFFRDLAKEAVKDSKTFGNSGQALEVLEKSWDMRSRGVKNVTCAKAMRELDNCILLV